MLEEVLPQRPQTSHSCAAGERQQNKIHNNLWDQMLRKSTADGFHHAKPRKQSPLRCNTFGNWSVLMSRTSSDKWCGDSVKSRIKNESMRTSFYKTDQFLSPAKTGYNEKTNDGQFRVIKVNHYFRQSDVLNQKNSEDVLNETAKYFHQMQRTQGTQFSVEKQDANRANMSPRRINHYHRYVATNPIRYYGNGEDNIQKRRDSKEMIKLIRQMEQTQLNKSVDSKRNNNSFHQIPTTLDSVRKKSIDRKALNVSALLRNNSQELNSPVQQYQEQYLVSNRERGRHASVGVANVSNSKRNSIEQARQQFREPFDQKVKKRTIRVMPQYMKDIIQSKKVNNSFLC